MAIVSFGAGFAIMMLSNILVLVLTAGIFLILYTLCASIYLRRSKGIDPRLKISVWQIIVIVLTFSVMLYGKVTFILAK